MSLLERLGAYRKAIGVLVLLVAAMGAVNVYKHRKEERLKREAEVAKAAAAAIEDRMLRLNSAAIKLESALRRKNIQANLVAAVNANGENQNLHVVVTRQWLDQPDQTQRQMAQSMALVLKDTFPPDGIPFIVVDEAGGFFKGGIRWWE